MIYDIRTHDVTLRDFINECAISMDIPNDGSHQLFIGQFDNENCVISIIDPTPTMLESKIKSYDDLGMKDKKYSSRIVFIGRDVCGYMGCPRIKVSAPIGTGTDLEKGSAVFYFDGGKVKSRSLDKKDVNLNSKEIKYYSGLFERNINLIKIATDSDKEKKAAEAIINDEKFRKDGKYVVRDENGNATVYTDKNCTKVLYTLQFGEAAK